MAKKMNFTLRSWLVMVMLVTIAAVTAVAVAQFRFEADRYRRLEMALVRLDGQLHRAHILMTAADADSQDTSELASMARVEVKQTLEQLKSIQGQNVALTSVYDPLEAYVTAATAYHEQQASKGKPNRKLLESAYRQASSQLQEVSSKFSAAAEESVYKSNLESAFGLLAFLVCVGSVLWRFAHARKQVEISEVEQQLLQRSEQRLKVLTEQSSDVTLIVDSEGKVQYATEAAGAVLGVPSRQLIGQDFALGFVDEGPEAVRAALKNCVERKTEAQEEVRYSTGRGEIWLEIQLRNEMDAESVGGIVIHARDISARKLAEEQLRHDALHDALTGMPNRSLLLERLQRAVNRGRRKEDYKYAVLFIDLDQFKLVNDSLGHKVGDDLLIQVTHRIRGALRKVDSEPGARPLGDDTLSRLGGDEFVVLLEDLRDLADAVRVAERILAKFEMPFEIDGKEIFTGASIGISTKSMNYVSGDQVLRDADIAMYKAKSNGRRCYAIFDEQMHFSAVRRLTVESELRRAIENRELVNYYQPIMNLETGRLESVEALVRWQHPERGLMSPAEFIPVAEETGLIVPLGKYVLEQGCFQMVDWKQRFGELAPKVVAINVSQKQFSQPDFIARLDDIIKLTRLNPEWLRLEITESASMQDPEAVCQILMKLRAIGVKVSIDDFGTGYSSLSYLRKLPIDVLKIDRSFVAAMKVDQESKEIVRMILTLASNLKMDVVAEGTETSEQVETLKEMRCHFAQGYFFSKPVSVQELEKLISAARTAVAGA